MNFDTHKSIKLLISQGVKESQAESIVEVVSQSREYDMSQLATKEQLNLVEEKLKRKIITAQNNVLKWIMPFLTGIMLSMLAVTAKLFWAH